MEADVRANSISKVELMVDGGAARSCDASVPVGAKNAFSMFAELSLIPHLVNE